MIITCPKCSGQAEITASDAGGVIGCPHCANEFTPEKPNVRNLFPEVKMPGRLSAPKTKPRSTFAQRAKSIYFSASVLSIFSWVIFVPGLCIGLIALFGGGERDGLIILSSTGTPFIFLRLAIALARIHGAILETASEQRQPATNPGEIAKEP